MEMTSTAQAGKANSLTSFNVTLILPEVCPRAAANCLEVFNFHDALTTLGHTQQLPVQIENLDAVVGEPQYAAQELCICLLANAGFMLLGPVANNFDVADMLSQSGSQRKRFAACPKPGAALAQVPALVEGSAVLKSTAHLDTGSVGRAILRGKEAVRRLPVHFCSRPTENVLGAGIPLGHQTLGIERDDRKVDSAFQDIAVQSAAISILHNLPRLRRHWATSVLAHHRLGWRRLSQ